MPVIDTFFKRGFWQRFQRGGQIGEEGLSGRGGAGKNVVPFKVF